MPYSNNDKFTREGLSLLGPLFFTIYYNFISGLVTLEHCLCVWVVVPENFVEDNFSFPSKKWNYILKPVNPL
jgi:hypothetical protein